MRRVAHGLGLKLEALPSATFRVRVRAGHMSYLWDPEEWALNVGIGCATALLGESADLTDIVRVVALLGIPEKINAPSDLPAWFVEAYRKGTSRLAVAY